jgi:hypothetical protein
VPDRSSAGSSSPPRWLPIRRPEIIVLLKQIQSGSFEPKGSDGGRRNNDDLAPIAKGQTKAAVANDCGGFLFWFAAGRSKTPNSMKESAFRCDLASSWLGRAGMRRQETAVATYD